MMTSVPPRMHAPVKMAVGGPRWSAASPQGRQRGNDAQPRRGVDQRVELLRRHVRTLTRGAARAERRRRRAAARSSRGRSHPTRRPGRRRHPPPRPRLPQPRSPNTRQFPRGSRAPPRPNRPRSAAPPPDWITYTAIQIVANAMPSTRRRRTERPLTPLVARWKNTTTTTIQTIRVVYSTASAVPDLHRLCARSANAAGRRSCGAWSVASS